MTTESRDDDAIRRRRNETSPSRGYEWTCPYCGKSRLNRSDGESGESNAIAALRTHVIASDGAGHGPRNEFPPDEVLELSEHVVEVDRGWGGDGQLED